MPFVIECPKCGESIEGDACTNSELLRGAVLHLHGREAVPMQSRAVPIHGQRQFNTAFDKDDTAIVWQHPGTGEVRYPGRADRPMPERYAQQGFVPRELRTDQAYRKFEKERGVLSERAWFDRGSGKSFDNDGRLPERRQ